jgi:2-oxoglutarate ferredoxin oxidoreductase subunit alpha
MHATEGATVGIIGFGSTEAAILEAKHQLETEHGIKADFMRIRALPFTQNVSEFVARYDQIFVVEMNRDGQMNQILTIEYPQRAPYFRSVAYGDGMPASARWVREGILAQYTPDASHNGGSAQARTAPTADLETALATSNNTSAEQK